MVTSIIHDFYHITFLKLSNPRRRNFLKDKLLAEQAFNQLTAEINSAHCDIEVLHLTKISPKQTDLINQGQEGKSVCRDT